MRIKKFSTLAKKVAAFYEEGGRWTKGRLRRATSKEARYCILGAAAKIVTLDKQMIANPLALTPMNLIPDSTTAQTQKINILEKIQFITQFNYHFRNYYLETYYHFYIDIPYFNDEVAKSKKAVIKEMRSFAKWLQKKGL